MTLQPGQIVKNLIPSEPVCINQVQQLGSMVSVKFTGINSNRSSTKVIGQADFDQLELLSEEGSFNFSGDPVRFALFAEAERINSACQFDPLFAVNCSLVDPLPQRRRWQYHGQRKRNEPPGATRRQRMAVYHYQLQIGTGTLSYPKSGKSIKFSAKIKRDSVFSAYGGMDK